ncbi:MAG: four helix bundle protein [Myxococcales bacterium]|nr:four helix bundle protein [Myxococcales bacterium]
MPLLADQKLDVYRRAIELLALASQIATSAPSGNSFLTEELKPAAVSIPWNIAEGAGRFGAPDGARFYSIARGSAMECKAIGDALAVLQLALEDTRRQAMELLTRIVEMLTRMCRRGDPPRESAPESTTTTTTTP